MSGMAIEGFERYSKHGSESQFLHFAVYRIESTAEATLCSKFEC